MVKGPGLFSDIGKKARDLLYKDYLVDQKFTLTTYSSTGLVFTTNATKKGDFLLADLTTQLKNKNVTTDIKVDTASNVFTTIRIDELTPGLKSILSFTIPDQRSGKVELQYSHDYVGVGANIGLTASPVVETSVVVGNEGVSLGGEVAFDTASSNLTKYNAGISYVKSDFTATVNWTDKGDTLKASLLQLVNPATRSAVAAEVAHSISKTQTTLTFGTQHSLDPLTTVKARVNNQGKIGALIQHEWRPRSLVTLSGEVDSKALDSTPKIGLSLALKP